MKWILIKTKTYKIGEHAVGGIVTITLKKTDEDETPVYFIEFKNYRTRDVVMKANFTNKQLAEDYIAENSTSYHADRIINFMHKKD